MGRLDALEAAQHIPQGHLLQVPEGPTREVFHYAERRCETESLIRDIKALQNHVMERSRESISRIDDIQSLLWQVFWRMLSPEENGSCRRRWLACRG